MADPLVTVVMPIRNEASFITRSLGAVLAQDYLPDKIEVLIADGMSFVAADLRNAEVEYHVGAADAGLNRAPSRENAK